MSNAVGSYLRHLPQHNLDNEPELTAEQVKLAYEEALRADQAHQDAIGSQKNGDAFVAAHPEFVDCRQNALLLLNQMNTMFGEGLHTLEHFEKAFEYLRTKTGFLKLNQAELAKQQRADAKQRYEQELALSTNDAWKHELHELPPSRQQELETMPLQDLRILAETEHRKNFRLAAERGGSDW
jgi:hypothetical protein